jgi:hypothetical protein
MNVRPFFLLVMPLLAAGCATQTPVAQKAPPLRPIALAMSPPAKLVETRYDVRSYRETANASVRHEAHAVYRTTRVPITVNEELTTVPRTVFPPASIAPLPASEELTAELATQRKITAEIRALQASMADTEQKMQAQFALLVRQSAEAIKLREQLEAERRRVRTVSGSETASISTAPAATATENSQVKW